MERLSPSDLGRTLSFVREIAAVKGIGVLWPGAGTLRGVFSSTNDKGERVLDSAGWENAIQQVLAACKEFHVPCIDVFHVEDGKVSAFDCHYAGTIMLAQLGVLGNLEASLKK